MVVADLSGTKSFSVALWGWTDDSGGRRHLHAAPSRCASLECARAGDARDGEDCAIDEHTRHAAEVESQFEMGSSL